MFEYKPYLLIMLYYTDTRSNHITYISFSNSNYYQILPCYNLLEESNLPVTDSLNFKFGNTQRLPDGWMLYSYRSLDYKTIYWSSKPQYSGVGTGNAESQFNNNLYQYYWIAFCE